MFDVSCFQKNRTGRFGADFYYFEHLDSSNRLASELAASGCPEGAIVLADSQSHGKGRDGASWFSPPDLNLHVSLILYPPDEQIKYLPFVTAMAIIKTLSTHGIQGDLKWPNDVLVRGKKISGVLIETAIEANRLKHAVVGAGINVNCIDFSPEIVESATSVAGETGACVSRELFLASFLREMETGYDSAVSSPWESYCRALDRHSSYLQDCELKIEQNGTWIEGTSRGMDVYGGLILETAEGRKVFYAGGIQSCRKK